MNTSIKKYGDEYTKALAVMIARGDFNKNSYHKEGLTINDLNTYLEYIDLNKYIETNSIELNMLFGKSVTSKLIKYYNDTDTVSCLRITGLDLLLYSAINNSVIFNKILNNESGDFSKVSYTLNAVIYKDYLQKAEILINNGASLNNIYPGSTITVGDIQLIDIMTSIIFKKERNNTHILNRLEFVLKDRENLHSNSYSILEDMLNINLDYIKKFYILDLELKSSDIFSKIEEFTNIVANIEINN